jgi:hypothetical protein
MSERVERHDAFATLNGLNAVKPKPVLVGSPHISHGQMRALRRLQLWQTATDTFFAYEILLDRTQTVHTAFMSLNSD